MGTAAGTRVRSWICTSPSFVVPLMEETAGTAVHLATAVRAACQVTAARVVHRVTAEAVAATHPAVVEATSVVAAEAVTRAAVEVEVIAAVVTASLEKLLRMK